MSLGYPPAFVEPAYRWVPPGGLGSYGDEVVGFTQSIGHGVDPEQARAIGDFTTYGPGGLYIASETCMIEGRQNGKTDRVGLPIALFDLFIRGLRAPDGSPDVLTWTSHVMDTTLGTFRTVKRLVEENPALSRRVKTLVEGKGEEAVELMDGSAMEFRTRGTGRGRSGSIWVADEWLEGTDAQVGTRMPTLRTRPGAQLRFYSSAGLAKSRALRKLVRRGRAGGDPGLVYIEYCGPGSFREPGCEIEECSHAPGTPGCTLDREELWHLGSHSLGRRVTYTWQRSERRSMDPTEFAREIFGWHETGDDEDQPVDVDDWAATAHELSELERKRLGEPVFFVDIAPGSRGAAIAVASLTGDSRPHVELADARLGTGWIRARILELAKDHPNAQWACEGQNAAAGLAGELSDDGIELELWTLQQMGRACAHLEQIAEQRAYTRHPEPRLDQAFGSAVKRDIGDSLWAWARRKSGADISPLVAMTGALGLLHERGDEIDIGQTIW